MRFRARVSSALLSVGLAAHASTVRDEISVDRFQSTAQNPRSGTVTNLLGASFDAGDDWVFSATGMVTLEGATAPASGGTGGTLLSFSLGADWDVTDKYSIGVRGWLSPQSTTRSIAPVTVVHDGRPTVAAAPVDVSGSSRAIELNLDYDSTGLSDLEWAASAGLTLAQDSTAQVVPGLVFPDGTVLSPQETRDACALRRSKCPDALLRALDGHSDDLGSARISLSGTAIVSRDTDLTLTGDYYLYDSDPAQFGYFGVAASRKQPEGIGAPIAPLLFLVRPEVAHRFGAFTLRLWAQFGRYAPGVADTTAGIGGRAQMRFGTAFRVWLAVSGRNDVDSQGDAGKSADVTVGGAWRF